MVRPLERGTAPSRDDDHPSGGSGGRPSPRRCAALAAAFAAIVLLDASMPDVSMAVLYVPLLLVVQQLLRPPRIELYLGAGCLACLAGLAWSEAPVAEGLVDRLLVCVALLVVARVFATRVVREQLATSALFQPWGFSGAERSALLAVIGDMQRDSARRRQASPTAEHPAAVPLSRHPTLVGFAFASALRATASAASRATGLGRRSA